MPYGALPQYLRRNADPSGEHLRFMHEIAMGMMYLHSQRGGSLLTLSVTAHAQQSSMAI